MGKPQPKPVDIRALVQGAAAEETARRRTRQCNTCSHEPLQEQTRAAFEAACEMAPHLRPSAPAIYKILCDHVTRHVGYSAWYQHLRRHERELWERFRGEA